MWKLKGGKRDGAGRHLSPNPANVQVHIKMTPEQHRKFLELGGSKWVKSAMESNMDEIKRLQEIIQAALDVAHNEMTATGEYSLAVAKLRKILTSGATPHASVGGLRGIGQHLLPAFE